MTDGPGDGQGGNSGSGGSGEVDWKARFEALGGDDAEKWKELSRRHETDYKRMEREVGRLKPMADELQRLKEAGQSDTERFTSLQAQYESLSNEHVPVVQERDSLKVENARLMAGLAHGLSLEDMKFIPAGPPEQMAADAKALAERLGARRTPDYDGGGRGNSAEPPKTFGDTIRNLRNQGRGVNAS